MSHLTIIKPQSSNLQTASIFNSPIEIRRAIYVHLIDTPGVHIVRTEQGNLQLYACVGPDRYAGHTGSERRTTDDGSMDDVSMDNVWGRRLVSSWGPHWECEEIALRRVRERDGDGDVEGQTYAAWRNNGAILGVCRKMHFEVMELMMELICFHVTDLHTLDALLEIPGASPSSPSPSIPLGFKDLFLPCITKLDITLRLPLPFFEALDGPHAATEGSPTPVFEDDLNIWSRLSLRITQLKELRSLHVWLDHTNKAYWSVVNECAILSQFEPLASNPHLDLCFDLPKLHPKLEDPQRHYIGDENAIDSSFASLSPLKIRRILRQRYQSKKNCIGYYQTTHAADFPQCLGHPMFRNMSLEDKEKWERPMWHAGIDVQYILSMPYIG